METGMANGREKGTLCVNMTSTLIHPANAFIHVHVLHDSTVQVVLKIEI